VSQFPPALLAKATSLRLRGRAHFAKDAIGEVVAGPDEEFVVFRKLIMDPPHDHMDPPRALFTVRFHFARLSANANKRLSLIPAPFIAAQPGFRSKSWMLGRTTGMFQGLYEFDSVANAEAYWDSFPLRLMKRRAVPESLWHEVRPI
jgi:Putative mono-oxygenase ydhR